MEYQIIYYNASKTALCERALSCGLSAHGFSHAGANAAATRQILGRFLSGIFCRYNLVFIVNGSSDDLKQIITSAIGADRNFGCEEFEDAFILTCAPQCLTVLPDDPQKITDLLESGISTKLRNIFSV